MNARVSASAVCIALLVTPPVVALAWDADGTRVCPVESPQVIVQPAIADGLGGTFIAWSDGRNGVHGPSGLYLTRLLPNGDRAPGWPAGGAFVADHGGGVLSPRMCTDGAGGAYLVWNAVRDRSPSADVLAMHVLADGTNAPGWPAGGLVVCDTTEEHRDPVCVPDGSGGVIVVWRDARDYPTTSSDLYAQRLTFDGGIATGWPSQGAPVTRSPLYEYGPVVAGDGNGGVWVAWRELMEVDGGLQHLGPNGQPIGSFPANGLRLRPGTGPKSPLGVLPSTDGSALVLWEDGRGGGAQEPPGAPGLYACRFVSDTTRAPGWPATGRALPEFPSLIGGFGFADPVGCPDDGVLLGWVDGERRMRVARVDREVALPTGWTTEGVVLSAPGAPALVPASIHVESDGGNGAFVAWSFNATNWSSVPGAGELLVSHVLGSGGVEPGWPAGGLAVGSTPAFEYGASLVRDGGGGVVAVFSRGLEDSSRLLAARVVAGGLVPVQVALVVSRWSGATIDLEWFLGGAPASVDVERDAGGGWMCVAVLAPDGEGRVAWSDADVVAGHAYAYRLRWNDGPSSLTGGDARVEVPAARLALRVQSRAGDVRLAFRLTLAPNVPARLALFDVQGRRAASVEIAAGEPQREVGLSAGGLAPGLYLARLEQRGERVAQRVIVSR